MIGLVEKNQTKLILFYSGMRKKEYDDKTLHEYARLNRVTLFIYQEITFF